VAAGVTADHLYSYAKQGIHQNEGVLLIPPDLPSLFVACLPKVEIAPAKITLDPILKKNTLSNGVLAVGNYKFC
jgi:hypothetical protein